MSDQKNSIIYHLELLHFLCPQQFEFETLKTLVDYVKSGVHNNTPIQHYDNGQNLIERCDDKIMKCCYLRQANNIEKKDDMTISYKNKRKYVFDNVFDCEAEIISDKFVDFLCKRVASQKDAMCCNYGLSKSGKTYLTNMILSKMPKPIHYRLSEVYLNKIYVYHGGLKVCVDKLKDDMKFYTDDIATVIQRFQTKSDNHINQDSSRSHTCIELFYDGCKVTLIDLAGNERMSRDKNETQYINKSLYSLSRYFETNGKHIDNKDKLLQFVKGGANIILNIILHDNFASRASDLLGSFVKLLV